MDRLQYLEANDVAPMMAAIDELIATIHRAECDQARFRHDHRDALSGEAVEAQEGKLRAAVLEQLNGNKSNEDTRIAMLRSLKETDPEWARLQAERAGARLALDQLDTDIRFYANKLNATLQAFRYRRAVLNFLAADG